MRALWRIHLLIVIMVAVSLFVSVPRLVSAENICVAANSKCAGPQSKGQPCVCAITGFYITGVCLATNDCKAMTYYPAAGGANPGTGVPLEGWSAAELQTIGLGNTDGFFGQVGSFISKNPLVSGIAISGGMMLLSSLMSPSGSSGGSGNTGVTNSTYCMSGQYYYSANPPPGDPCAVYSANGGTGSTVPTTGADDTNISDLLNGLDDQTPITVTTDDTNLDGIINGSGCPTISSLVTCSDGFKEESQGLDSKGCALEPVCVPDTSQSGSGTQTGQSCGSGSCPIDSYCSTVMPGQCVPNGRVDCGSYSCVAGASCGADDQCVDPNVSTVEEVSTSEAVANKNLYKDKTGANTPDPSKTDLNQKKIPVPADGVHGDLRSFGGGVTIYARSRSGGTEISGFYGGTSSGGLCTRRPWASNFLSYVVPPAFFDNLCSMAGLGAGRVTTGFGGNGGVGTTRAVTGPAGPAYTPPAPQTGVNPEAKIRASPASVNIGGRTTVFWTSHDVSSCEESSSDGNFSGSSTSGGASTVALSGPVTFYIRCLGVDGKYIQDSTTVNIGI